MFNMESAATSRPSRERKPISRLVPSVAASGTPRTWTDNEKEQLLVCLRKHNMDMKKLMEAVPTKTGEDIQNFIILWRKLGRMSLKPYETKRRGIKLTPGIDLLEFNDTESKQNDQRAPIQKWLDHMEQNTPAALIKRTKLIAKCFKYIADYESHLSPDSCGGVNLKELYEFLYSVLNGDPPKWLDKETLVFLMHSMDCLKLEAERLGCGLENYFQNVNKLSYTQSNEVPRNVFGIEGFNPFQIPEELLHWSKSDMSPKELSCTVKNLSSFQSKHAKPSVVSKKRNILERKFTPLKGNYYRRTGISEDPSESENESFKPNKRKLLKGDRNVPDEKRLQLLNVPKPKRFEIDGIKQEPLTEANIKQESQNVPGKDNQEVILSNKKRVEISNTNKDTAGILSSNISDGKIVRKRGRKRKTADVNIAQCNMEGEMKIKKVIKEKAGLEKSSENTAGMKNRRRKVQKDVSNKTQQGKSEIKYQAFSDEISINDAKKFFVKKESKDTSSAVDALFNTTVDSTNNFDISDTKSYKNSKSKGKNIVSSKISVGSQAAKRKYRKSVDQVEGQDTVKVSDNLTSQKVRKGRGKKSNTLVIDETNYLNQVPTENIPKKSNDTITLDIPNDTAVGLDSVSTSKAVKRTRKRATHANPQSVTINSTKNENETKDVEASLISPVSSVSQKTRKYKGKRNTKTVQSHDEVTIENDRAIAEKTENKVSSGKTEDKLSSEVSLVAMPEQKKKKRTKLQNKVTENGVASKYVANKKNSDAISLTVADERLLEIPSGLTVSDNLTPQKVKKGRGKKSNTLVIDEINYLNQVPTENIPKKSSDTITLDIPNDATVGLDSVSTSKAVKRTRKRATHANPQSVTTNSTKDENETKDVEASLSSVSQKPRKYKGKKNTKIIESHDKVAIENDRSIAEKIENNVASVKIGDGLEVSLVKIPEQKKKKYAKLQNKVTENGVASKYVANKKDSDAMAIENVRAIDEKIENNVASVKIGDGLSSEVSLVTMPEQKKKKYAKLQNKVTENGVASKYVANEKNSDAISVPGYYTPINDVASVRVTRSRSVNMQNESFCEASVENTRKKNKNSKTHIKEIDDNSVSVTSTNTNKEKNKDMDDPLTNMQAAATADKLSNNEHKIKISSVLLQRMHPEFSHDVTSFKPKVEENMTELDDEATVSSSAISKHLEKNILQEMENSAFSPAETLEISECKTEQSMLTGDKISDLNKASSIIKQRGKKYAIVETTISGNTSVSTQVNSKKSKMIRSTTNTSPTKETELEKHVTLIRPVDDKSDKDLISTENYYKVADGSEEITKHEQEKLNPKEPATSDLAEKEITAGKNVSESFTLQESEVVSGKVKSKQKKTTSSKKSDSCETPKRRSKRNVISVATPDEAQPSETASNICGHDNSNENPKG